MPNDKSGNQRIEVTLSRTKICEFTPTPGLNGANDFDFYKCKIGTGEFDFDQIQFVEDENHILIPEMKERPWL